MLPEKDIYCHRTGFEKTCFSCVVDKKCRLWLQLNGTNPLTGEALSQWNCADYWDSILKVENIKKTNEVGAAVEDFRNRSLEISRAHAAEQIAERLKSYGQDRIIQLGVDGNPKGSTCALPPPGSLE